MTNRKTCFTFFALGCILLLFSSHQVFAACTPTATEPCFIRTIYTRHSANSGWWANFDSPDPSGMAYMSSSDRLAVCDGEVDEMTIYNDANLFAMNRRGDLLEVSTTVVPANNPYSNEPVGCAYSPTNGHLYISDDDKNRVFDIAPGPDGIPLTGDDPLPTSMSTSSVCSNFNSGGSGDPEGLGYGFDPITGRNTLFLFDGSNSEVYMVTSGRTDGIFDNTAICRRHFDTKSQGVTTPDGGDYDPDNSGYLYIWADAPDDKLNQFNPAGTKVRSFDISNINPKRPAGVAAVSKRVTGDHTHVYLADRGSDNDSNPNENDGKIHEFAISALSSSNNQPPNVSAGPDQSISLPTSANLDGTVTDDGLPDPPGNVTTRWIQSSGPGTVTFGNADAVDTTASFTESGTYVLRLRADDGALQSHDEVTITVNPPLAAGTIYISTADNGTVGGLSFRDEDILVFTGSWSMYFDGSDVGLGSADIDAFHIMADSSILLSFRADTNLTLAMVNNPMASDCTGAVPVTATVDNSDVLRFIPTSTGRNTAGCFAWFLDASNVGLTLSSENVDAIGFSPLPGGNLVVSTTGSFSVPGATGTVSGSDEDLLVFNETSFGQNTTSGTWALYFDGSDVGLGGNSSEDIDGTSIDGSSGNIYLTTNGAFSVPGATGDGNDIFMCAPGSTGPLTSCSYTLLWKGDDHGLGSNNLDAIDIQ